MAGSAGDDKVLEAATNELLILVIPLGFDAKLHAPL